jgi:FtsP/CotA-like multicopper oxidase with cupredoxin domain
MNNCRRSRWPWQRRPVLQFWRHLIGRPLVWAAALAAEEANMAEHASDHAVAAPDHFSTDAVGLPESGRPELVELADGDSFEIEIAAVSKRLGGATVRMLSYNGSIPGPTLKVRQGSGILVTVTNHGDHEDTIHWHGLRLENRYDGTHQTQAPISVGASFAYRLDFPDPGVYWYHPHIREDYGQELGLYGNILVLPDEPDYWPPVNRELAITLDDVLVEDGKIAPFSRSQTTHTAMGRFGNVLLVNGEPEIMLGAQLGEVVRMYLTNTANTRVFNVALDRAQMKLVGSDSGHYEREEPAERVLLAPSERAVVDVLFDRPGTVTLEHHTPERTYTLGTVAVSETEASPSFATDFRQSRTNEDMAAERARIAPHVAVAPDKTLAFVAEMDMGVPEGPVVYTCPMHPEVVEAEEGTCPKCGMKLLATALPVTYTCPMQPDVVSAEEGRCPKCGMKLLPAEITYACPMHPDVVSNTPDRCPKCGMKLLPSRFVSQASMSAAHSHESDEHQHSHGDGHDHSEAGGIEWEDDMVEVNRITTPANMRWKLIDRSTGAENTEIDWHFHVGDRVKIRLLNEMDSDHPMHHPFHIHGAGRFLILSRNGVVEPNLVWKDTVLVRTGETVDILLEVTNAGLWMAHCHIAEHHESGMMFSFRVDP